MLLARTWLKYRKRFSVVPADCQVYSCCNLHNRRLLGLLPANTCNNDLVPCGCTQFSSYIVNTFTVHRRQLTLVRATYFECRVSRENVLRMPGRCPEKTYFECRDGVQRKRTSSAGTVSRENVLRVPGRCPEKTYFECRDGVQRKRTSNAGTVSRENVLRMPGRCPEKTYFECRDGVQRKRLLTQCERKWATLDTTRVFTAGLTNCI